MAAIIPRRGIPYQRKLGEGAAEEDLLDAYPRLSREDLQAVRAFVPES